MATPDYDNVTNFFLGSAAGVVNNNFEKTAEAIDKTIQTDGSREMNANLDMNSNRLINLSPAVTNNQAVTLGQFKAALSDVTVINYLDADEGLWDPTNTFNQTEGLWNG